MSNKAALRVILSKIVILLLLLVSTCNANYFASLSGLNVESSVPGTNYSDVTNDIACTMDIPQRNYTSLSTPPIRATFSGFFNMNGSRPEDTQILAVAAIFSRLLVSRHRDFMFTVDIDLVMNEYLFLENSSDSIRNLFNKTYEVFERQREQQSELNQTVLLGPLSSQQTRLINGLATVNTAPIVSYSATVSSLSSKYDYPWFFRVCYSDVLRWQAMADLMTHFGWRKAVMLTTPDFFGTASDSTLRSLLKANALSTYVTTFDPSKMDEIARSIRDSGLRVIFLVTGFAHREMLNCMTMGLGCSENYNMTHANGYQWILGDGYPLYERNPSPAYCTALSGALVVEFAHSQAWFDAANGASLPFPYSAMTYRSVFEEAVEIFEAQYGPVYFKEHFWHQEYVPFLVDCFFSVAHAYRTLRRQNQLPIGCALKKALKSVSFQGMTGEVAFDEQQDRTVSAFELTSVVRNESCSDLKGNRFKVARWTSNAGLEMTGLPPEWNNQIISDGYVLPFSPRPTSPRTGIIVASILIICLTIPTVVGIFYYRQTRTIRTSPIAHLLLFTLSIDLLLAAIIPVTANPTRTSCIMQVALLFSGYLLGIATLGGKALIYELMSRNPNQRLKRTTNWRIIYLTGAIIVPALLVCAIVLFSDVPKVAVSIESDRYVARCVTKKPTGNYVLMALCGVLSLAALALSFKNRSNPGGTLDAKYLLFAVGNTTLLALVTMFIAFLLRRKDAGTTVIVLVVAIAFGSIANWGLIFGPRIFKLRDAHKKGTLWISKPPPKKHQLRHMFGETTPENSDDEDEDIPLEEPLSPISRPNSASPDLPQDLSVPLIDPNEEEAPPSFSMDTIDNDNPGE